MHLSQLHRFKLDFLPEFPAGTFLNPGACRIFEFNIQKNPLNDSTMSLEHVELSNRIYDRVKQMILSNELQPGEKIRQEKLALDLGVSRTPLLKALQLLETEWLVESLPRRGMVVKKMDREEIVEAFDCREGIECVATRLAAGRITDAQVAKLRKLFDPFRGKGDDVDLKAYKLADQQFHRQIIAISGNRILAKIEVLGNIHPITYREGLIRPPSVTMAEHDGILDALARRDPEAAESRMRSHIRLSRELIANAKP